MIKVGAVVVLSALIGAGAFVLTETAAGFRSIALVALDFDVENDELNEAREPIVALLESAIDATVDAATTADITAVTPEGDSRIEVVVTSPEPETSRIAAARVSAELRKQALDVRLAASRSELAEVEADLDARARERSELEADIDDAIRDEAVLTRRTQAVVLESGDETALREQESAAIERVREIAMQRDVIADEESRLITRRRELQLDIELNQAALFVVPPTQPENVSGSPVRNGAEAFLFSVVTLATALAVVHVGRRAQ